MNKLSNTGQSLAIFIVFIPVFIIIGTFAVDITYAKYNMGKLNERSKMIIRYGLNHIDESPYEDMVDLIYQNNDDIDNYSIDINEENKEITMTITAYSKSFFGKIMNKNIFKQKSSYKGYIKDDRKIIEEVK